MNVKERLTAKQEAFCIALEIDKLSQRQAYIKAFGRNKNTDKSLDELSCRLQQKQKIKDRIEQLRVKVESRAVWKKEEMLKSLKGIHDKASDNMLIEGDDEEYFNSKAGGLAVKCIETASKMLGYDEPIKVDGEIKITLTKEIEEYGE